LATLVLSTVGTVLGGPVGSAIGALIGQSIDQELLAPVRRGPRIGDLAVQTSSYGTQVPRLYGTMRVAGSVIWATDLVEHVDSDGAKGSPDVTYSYTVSLAVALSSRAATAVKRIWADGKLLRGANGDFKVGTKFRFHSGSEDQDPDPLIASAEGIGETPGYRGFALAVFEDLELGEFGNRIPFLTFEVEADPEPPSVGSVLVDVSDGAIVCEADRQLIGFAAYGRSTRNAIEPLVDGYGIELFDDGAVLRAAKSTLALPVDENEFGNSAEDSPGRLHREQLPLHSVATALRISYYDQDRDYQTGEARAVAGEQAGNEAQRDLAVVLHANDAKSLAQDMIAREWAGRDRLTLRLPPQRLPLEPGTKLALPLSPKLWTVDKMTIEGFVAVVDLRPSIVGGNAVTGDGGRIVPNEDVIAGPVSLALLDVPNVLGEPSSQPMLLLAAANATAGWKRRMVQVDFGQTLAVETARRKSVLGRSITVLAAGGPHLIDQLNSVDVQLIDWDAWLTSCDNDGLAAGRNLAMLGSELIQFGRATALGDGRFRLSNLLRGRGGSEWACGAHIAGDLFCLLQTDTLQPIALPDWSVGATVSASLADGSGTAASIAFRAEILRPPSPVRLTAEFLAAGDLVLRWIRRSRQGFAWVDEIDAPLGEGIEQYCVTLTSALATIELSVSESEVVIAPSAVAELGTGIVSVEVRQIGDRAASRPAQIALTLSKETP
jgi:hypothetical protein